MVHSRDALIPVRDMSALIARLEAAAGGSQALTDDTLRALGFVTRRYPMDSDRYWIVPGDDRHPLPPWCDKITVSLDAALALSERVLPLHDWSVGHLPVSDDANHEEHHSFGCLFYAHSRVASPSDGMAHGATPALAVVTAILKAKAQGEGGHG